MALSSVWIEKLITTDQLQNRSAFHAFDLVEAINIYINCNSELGVLK